MDARMCCKEWIRFEEFSYKICEPPWAASGERFSPPPLASMTLLDHWRRGRESILTKARSSMTQIICGKSCMGNAGQFRAFEW